MSTLAITAAHFVTIPARYAVGRWYNIPTNTLLAFNAVNFGFNILAGYIVKKITDEWKLTSHQERTIAIVSLTCAMLSALYLTSILTNSMPIECAAMTTLAAFTSIYALVALVKWSQGEHYQAVTQLIGCACAVVFALYITSKLTNPMEIKGEITSFNKGTF